ncbi:M42 family metallopeptidase [Porcipelethomonas sp.]|uniref:M42 family metallopeptidase n=1 Tax=Porcipelethomonas sp. TaxID=2981675 RepID=UPI003EFAF110
MDLKNIIFELTSTWGISGEENNVAQTALKYLKNYTNDCYIKNGNVIGNFGQRTEKRPHILIDAHIDQIGLVVTGICESGFIHFSNIGGIDRRLLPAQQVCIYGRKEIPGIICSVPPHLSSGENKVLKIDEFYIDTGYDFDTLKSIVSPGDKISFSEKPKALLNNRITGMALDDRSGIAAILYALELLEGTKYGCSFSVLFSTQEELGERGASIAAYDINPDIALAVDVSFAYCTGEKEYECGKFGKGPMIGVSPSLSREITDRLTELCISEKIPYQTEVMSGLTSTNADRFSVNRCGCKACTISVPLRYMHTPVEIIQLEDVENTGRLIAAYIRSFTDVQ